MKDGLYNKGIYWSSEVDTAVKTMLNKRYKVVPTFHVYNKIDKLRLPKGCYTTVLHGKVVEAEVENGQVVKVITRLQNKFRPKQDICAAVRLNLDSVTNQAVVKTIWTNAHDDDHETINVSNYVKG